MNALSIVTKEKQNCEGQIISLTKKLLDKMGTLNGQKFYRPEVVLLTRENYKLRKRWETLQFIMVIELIFWLFFLQFSTLGGSNILSSTLINVVFKVDKINFRLHSYTKLLKIMKLNNNLKKKCSNGSVLVR